MSLVPGLPTEFADLLSARGRRVLEGKAHAGILKTGQRFFAARGLLDAGRCRAVLAWLEKNVRLKRMEQPIPPESIWGMTENYAELLPKTVRVQTALRGDVPFLKSDSFRQFASVLAGRSLRKRWGTQVLAYGPGDHAGPHNDHHPEDAEARDGYTDVHLTFCTQGVKQQLLVYEQQGHFSEAVNVGISGSVTAYRLPFWHYATPLQASAATARRWVLLGTFIDEKGDSPPFVSRRTPR